MARKVDVEVEIDAQGNVQVHVKGRKGKGCLEFLELLQQAVGPVKSQSHTQEFYEQEVQVRQTQETKGRKG